MVAFHGIIPEIYNRPIQSAGQQIEYLDRHRVESPCNAVTLSNCTIYYYEISAFRGEIGEFFQNAYISDYSKALIIPTKITKLSPEN